MRRSEVPRYIGFKLMEGVGLGILLYVPWCSDRCVAGLTWSIACSIIVSFGIDYLCEKIP